MSDLSSRHAVIPRQSREEALSSGHNLYWTGVECRNGHIDYRYVSNRDCVSCMQQRRRPSEEEAAAARDLRRKIEDRCAELAAARELNGYE